MVKPIPQYGDDVGSTPALMSMLKCLNLCTESKHPIDLFLKNVQWYNGCTWGFDPHEPGSNPGWTTNLNKLSKKSSNEPKWNDFQCPYNCNSRMADL